MRRLGAAAAALILLAAVAAWWFRAPATAPAPVLTVLVDGRPSATVEAGSPIFAEVFLHGTRTAAGPTIGGWLRAWHQLIRIDVTRDGARIEVPFVETAAPRVREATTDGNGQSTFAERTPSRASLDGFRRVYRVERGASPDATRGLAPGRYQLVASLQVPFWQFWSWRGRAQSAPATVTVNAAADRDVAGIASFLYKTGRFSDAARLARDWAAREPNSVGASLLLGDALLASGDRDGARDAWERALDLANAKASKEPPIGIYRRLDRLARMR